jgi:hypothetical protein
MKQQNESHRMAAQRQQIEVLWETLKVLRYEAEWHMRQGPLENDDYPIWSGRSWAAYAFVSELLDKRLGLLGRSLRSDVLIEVGDLAALPAMLPVNSELPADHYVGRFFDSSRGRTLQRNAHRDTKSHDATTTVDMRMPNPSPDERIEIVTNFLRGTRYGAPNDDPKIALVDLLADLMWFGTAIEGDGDQFNRALLEAQEHFTAEMEAYEADLETAVFGDPENPS